MATPVHQIISIDTVEVWFLASLSVSTLWRIAYHEVRLSYFSPRGVLRHWRSRRTFQRRTYRRVRRARGFQKRAEPASMTDIKSARSSGDLLAVHHIKIDEGTPMKSPTRRRIAIACTPASLVGVPTAASKMITARQGLLYSLSPRLIAGRSGQIFQRWRWLATAIDHW